VRPLFEALSGIHYDNPSAHFYDMFSEKKSLDAVLDARCMDQQTEVIYLAAHGDATRIGGAPGHDLSRTELRNIIERRNITLQLKGLYLGTCLTGNKDMGKFFLEYAPTNLEWLAGYGESVDWVDGSAIDMVFFSKLTEEYLKNAKRKKGKKSARTMAHLAAGELLKLIPGAHAKYGFNLFMHENRKLTSIF